MELINKTVTTIVQFFIKDNALKFGNSLIRMKSFMFYNQFAQGKMS